MFKSSWEANSLSKGIFVPAGPEGSEVEPNNGNGDTAVKVVQQLGQQL